MMYISLSATATLRSKFMAKGKVKWFNASKGFGFIEREDGTDLFVHHKEIKTEGFRTLEEGEEVEFDVRQGDKGDYAANVVKIN